MIIAPTPHTHSLSYQWRCITFEVAASLNNTVKRLEFRLNILQSVYAWIFKWSVYAQFWTKPTYSLFSVPIPDTCPVLALHVTLLGIGCWYEARYGCVCSLCRILSSASKHVLETSFSDPCNLLLRYRPRGNMKLSCTLIFGFRNRWIDGRTDRQKSRRWSTQNWWYEAFSQFC
jgi:hypothetical protein